MTAHTDNRRAPARFNSFVYMVLRRRDDGQRGLHSSHSMAFHDSTLSVRRTLPVPGAEEVAFHCAVEVAKGGADLREGPVDSQGELLVCIQGISQE